jgi:hypothetical protein
MENVFFQERQYFRQWFIWILIGGLDLLFLWAFIQQVILGQPFGDNPGSTAELLAIAGIMAIFTFFMATAHLRTEITEAGIEIAFFPFLRTRFRWEDIAEARVRSYRPLTEYGGWGIRFGREGIAYNVSGNMGLELILKKGEKVLIGTRQPDELRLLLQNRSLQ